MSTIWLPDEPRGDQRPQELSHPPYELTSGPDAVELAESAGLVLDPWQRLCLDVILGEREPDRWAAFETGVLVARQNGKGGIIEALSLAGLFLFGERLILYSAHQFKTATEHFLRLMELIENAPHLRKLCKPPRTSHGEEQFERLNGQRLRFVARSRQSQRGFTGDRLLLDEAQELSRSAVGAALPTLRTRPNPQVNYFGTVPEPVNDSEHWEQLRDRGRAGDDRLAWLEWRAHTDDLDDRENWKAANPALGIRVREESIRDERGSLGDEGFAREILCIWKEQGYGAVIDLDVWASLADPTSKTEGDVAFAVDIPPERDHTSIAVSGRRADGLTHVELVERRPGTTWAVDRLVELDRKWKPTAIVLDPASAAGSLITKLTNSGLEPELVSGREMAQACGTIYDEINDLQLRHLNQTDLNLAVDAARKRRVSDSWAWHRRDTASDISPLVAATLARHGLDVPSKRRVKTGKAAFV